MAKDTKKENPLLSKNIPRPPVSSQVATEVVPASIAGAESVVTEKDKTVEYGKTVKSGNTAKITIYPSREQVDKLYDLMEAYRRRTGIRVNQQDIIRRLIDIADINTVLP